MNNQDYHNDTSRISKSGLDLIAKSPALYYEKYLSGKPQTDQTDAMKFGSAFHTYVLEPHLFSKEYFLLPRIDMRTKSGKELYEKLITENKEKIALSVEDYDTICYMSESLSKNPIVQELFSEKDKAQIESTFLFRLNGVECKCRPDYYDGNIILDLKTTECASPIEFGKSAFNFRYYVQSPFYIDGIQAATGETPNGFAFIACEKKPPYLNAVYFITDVDIQLGRDEYTKDLRTYKKCLESGIWHGYNYDNGYTMKPLELPSWAYSRTLTI